jgi:hypothetical protein
VAPPKRKTGSGRVTPKGGGKPGTVPTAGAPKARASSHDEDDHSTVAASSRYTPPTPYSAKHSPTWWPYFMLGLFAIGGTLILLRYLGWVPGGQDASQWWIVGGLAFVLGGLVAATKWR